MDLTRDSKRWKWLCPWSWDMTTSLGAMAVAFVVFTVFMYTSSVKSRFLAGDRPSGCRFPAIYNFGDSNSDTGCQSAAFGRAPPPNGETFFGKPSGRYSDGRLIIDFIAEKLGLAYLSAYLDSFESNFSHGANFAASGATIQHGDGRLYDAGFNPFSLDLQLLQFEQIKARTAEIYNQAQSTGIKSGLPRPEDFSNALYTVDCGQNDLHDGLTTMTEEEVKSSIPKLIDQFALAIETLYEQGGRAFWIHNTGPIGCLPFFVILYPPKPGNADKHGCVRSYNEVAQVFNKQLKERVYKLRIKLHDALLTYVDIYSVKYSLISEGNEHGFADPLGYCCGHLGDYNVDCGRRAMVNGTEVYGAACINPLEHISWDGIHYTEAANKWASNQILDGSFSDPPVPIVEACLKPSSSKS